MKVLFIYLFFYLSIIITVIVIVITNKTLLYLYMNNDILYIV